MSFGAAELEVLVPRLRRYARALTGGRDAADDLVQDTLERAWNKRALWRPGSDLRAWLFALMHNVYVNGLRRLRDTTPLEGSEALARAAPGTAEGAAVIGEVGRALAQLPADQREVILLVGLEQFSYAEAAELLGVPIGSVMSRLSRGRERLRGLLEEPERAPLLRRVK